MFLIVKFNVLFIKRQVLGSEGRTSLGKVIGMCCFPGSGWQRGKTTRPSFTARCHTYVISLLFEAGSRCMLMAGLGLTTHRVLLPVPPECLYYRCVIPHLAHELKY